MRCLHRFIAHSHCPTEQARGLYPDTTILGRGYTNQMHNLRLTLEYLRSKRLWLCQVPWSLVFTSFANGKLKSQVFWSNLYSPLATALFKIRGILLSSNKGQAGWPFSCKFSVHIRSQLCFAKQQMGVIFKFFLIS